MADIFISYAHSDRDKIEALAAALEAHGYSVWWDRHIEAGSEFSADIERELDAARGVVVCWSQSANQSHWVKDEASAAAEQDKLIPVALDGERAPMGFRQYQALHLDGRDRPSRDSAMAELIAAIEAKLSGEKIDHPQSGGVAAPARKTRYSLYGAIAGALIFVGATFFALAPRDAKDPASDASLVDTRPSIAVMAFENISANADQIYFSKGISEEILNGLAQIDALRVSGRTSSFALSQGDRDVQSISRLLNVDHVLDGSVRTVGDRVRITAQLIDGEDGQSIWSETFDRRLEDIFAIQEEIAQVIVSRLQVTLSDVENGVLIDVAAAPPTINTYKTYLRGVEAYRNRNVFGDDGAIALLERAAAESPTLVPARAHLAAAYSIARLNSLRAEDSAAALKYRDQTITTADNVIAESPENSLALAALGNVRLQEGDIIGARRYYERAIAADPRDESPALFLSILHFVAGDLTTSRTILLQALINNPVSPNVYRNLTLDSIERGEFEQAMEYAERTEQYGLDHGLRYRAIVSGYLGDYDAAKKLLVAYNSSEEMQRLGKLDPLALDAIYDPQARQQWLSQQLESDGIGIQALTRFLGADDIADQKLSTAAAPNGELRRSPLSFFYAWNAGASGFRETAEFKEIAKFWNLDDYWREYGFPPLCRPLGDQDFECD